jgi:hypothetical protein
MAMLATLEAGSRFTDVLSCSTAAVRQFDSNFVSHKVSFMIFCHTFLRSFTRVEFLMKHIGLCQETSSKACLPQIHTQACNKTASAVESRHQRSRNILELYRNDRANLSEASLQILLACLFWQATDIDLVRLKP